MSPVKVALAANSVTVETLVELAIVFTEELPTKKADVLTTTLEPTNKEVADREVELITLLTVLLPTVIIPVIVVLPS